ncbi:MAG TPA: Smr/MutS family protein [Luteolibacter sp.]
MNDDEAHPDPVEVTVTNELDLHTFRPSEIGCLLPEYFAECQRLGLRGVRVIHGKGTGALREGVHALFRRLPEVAEFHYPAAEGGWGATWVILKPPALGSTAGPTAG